MSCTIHRVTQHPAYVTAVIVLNTPDSSHSMPNPYKIADSPHAEGHLHASCMNEQKDNHRKNGSVCAL